MPLVACTELLPKLCAFKKMEEPAKCLCQKKCRCGIPDTESSAGLAFVPVFATIGFYAIPPQWQDALAIQLAPQLMAYLALSIWMYGNGNLLVKLGLANGKIQPGLFWGTITGMMLGAVNTVVILYIYPALGQDIQFLSQIPHALVPFWIMVPWVIIIIAMAVEVNFRGFLLGRLLVFFNAHFPPDSGSTSRIRLQAVLPLTLSALTFSYDPFMVATFRHLHWIAMWDGLVWGWMWMRMHNLYAVITAHAVEVMILYLLIRGALT